MKQDLAIGIIGGTQGLGARFSTYFQQKFPEFRTLVSGRSTKLTNQELVARADVVIFATPIAVTHEVIESCVGLGREDQLWMDFTSIKQAPVAKMLESKAGVCGLHPLFGPMPQIEGLPIVMCPERLDDDGRKIVEGLFAGFDLVEMSPSQHDDLMGMVQCAAHFSDMVMGETLKNSGFDFERIWRIASPAYRLQLQTMGRMYGETPELYADIAIENPSSLAALELFISQGEKLKSVVADKNRAVLVERLTSTKDYLGADFCQKAYRDSRQFLAKLAPEKISSFSRKTFGDLAVFGGKNSHTETAAKTMFAGEKESDIGRFSTIEEVCEAVSKGRFARGILPYENSREGAVFGTLDGLFSHENLQIVRRETMAISQNLLGLPGAKLYGIQTVISHPQALAQSRDWLREKCSNAGVQARESTAKAAEEVLAKGDETVAAIGSVELAQSLGLEVLESDIEGAGNETSFVEVRGAGDLEPSEYTSLVFWFRGDQAGNLAVVLTWLAEQNINLTKLDSRRHPDLEFGGYLFFADGEVDQVVFRKKHLPNLESMVSGVRVLGGY